MTKFFELFATNVRSILAILITVGGFGFLFSILAFRIPTGNETILNVAAGLVLGVMTTVASYYYGSSKDKSDVDKSDSMIEKKEAGVIQ
jgi:hypothetical protein